MRRISPAPSACPPMRRRAGGASRGSAPCPTRSSPPTTATPCWPREKFAEYIDPAVQVITLVDFENDCVRTSLEVARALGDRLYGVRLDTSEKLVDQSVDSPDGALQAHRRESAAGMERARRRWTRPASPASESWCPADSRSRRSASSSGKGCRWTRTAWARRSSPARFDFTADVVLKDGEPCAKVGREFRPNPRLERVL